MSSAGTRSIDLARPRRRLRTGLRRTGARVRAKAGTVVAVVRARTGESWARAEISRFKGTHGTHTDEELAHLFGRSVEQIRALAHELRLSKDKNFVKRLRGKGATRMPRWKEAEVLLLRELYPTRTNLELARRLERSAASIVTKAHYLRIKKSDQRLREMGRENVSLRYAMAKEGATLRRPVRLAIGGLLQTAR